ncbi:polysaccharide deacetylase family protein [Halosimplex halobium]|uniref:polysaccharide deacetylase family protein n=1 Tax=Halosimplex halobium TaxID=3396618 RepID=UPI003F56FEA7
MDDWTIGAPKGESDCSGEQQHSSANRTDRHRHSTPAFDETVTNVLSFDLEHWHSATLISEHITSPDDRIEESVRRVLEILDAHNVTATFFTVGEIAREYPGLIGRIADKGHEVASHGDTHTPLSDLDRRTFKAELKRSSDAIERVTGTSPEGFRAPNFSLEPTTAWAAQTLAAAGFAYDASIFPIQTPMYGVSSAPVRPYRFHPEQPFTSCDGRSGTSASLVELPAAVFHPWFRLPVAGGFYGRVLPRELLEAGIRNLNRRGAPAILYFHPWEFNPDVPTTGLPWHKRFVSFHGIDGLGEKLGTILDSFAFDTAEAAVATVEADGFRETDSHERRTQI